MVCTWTTDGWTQCFVPSVENATDRWTEPRVQCMKPGCYRQRVLLQLWLQVVSWPWADSLIILALEKIVVCHQDEMLRTIHPGLEPWGMSTLTWHYPFGMGETSGTIYLAAGAKIWDTRTCPWCLEDQLQIPSSCRNLQLHPTRTKRGRQTNKLLVHRNILIHSMFYTFFTILNYLLHTISMWRLHHTVPWLLHYSEDKHIYRFCSTYTNGSK